MHAWEVKFEGCMAKEDEEEEEEGFKYVSNRIWIEAGPLDDKGVKGTHKEDVEIAETDT